MRLARCSKTSVKAINHNAGVNVQEKSDCAVVCAEQRPIHEGSSPSGVRMRSAVFERRGNSSPAGRVEGMEKPKRAQRRKPDTAKADLKHRSVVPEGRVSAVRRNPKGMRRSTGP